MYTYMYATGISMTERLIYMHVAITIIIIILPQKVVLTRNLAFRIRQCGNCSDLIDSRAFLKI